MPTLRQMQCLVAVAEERHFRKAATRLHLSQPALSAQIAQMEEKLGVLLVERTRRRVLMTDMGRDITERCRSILLAVQEMQDFARQGKGALAGTLRLGVLRTLGPYLLPHILGALRQSYPDLKLYLREEPRDQLLMELARGDLDLVLLTRAPKDDVFLTAQSLFREPLWLALPMGHALARQKTIKPHHLKGEKFILLEVGDGLREPALDLCHRAGAMEHPDFRATSLDAVRQMVATGLGATLLPAMYVLAEALADDQIEMRPLASDKVYRTIDLVWRRTTAHADDYKHFARLILDNQPYFSDGRPVLLPIDLADTQPPHKESSCPADL